MCIPLFGWGFSSPELDEGCMGKNSPVVLYSSDDATELQGFALWFHQDSDLLFSSFAEGAQMYRDMRSAERLAVLKSELNEFVLTHSTVSEFHAREEWLKLGAEWWDSSYPLIATLRDFAKQL